MLRCMFVKSVLLFVLSSWITFALPETRHTSPSNLDQPQLASRQVLINNYNYLDDTYKLRFKSQCTKQMVHDILFGWAEAGVLANALAKWNPLSDDKYTQAVDHYLGTESRQSASTIQQVATNQVNIHADKWPSYDYVYVYCDERLHPDKPLCSPPEANAGVIAYTQTSLPKFLQVKTIHDLIICPLYYKQDSLATKVDTTRQKSLQAWQDIANTYGTRADTMFHESFHWHPTVRDPIIDDRPQGIYKGIYGPWNVSYLAEWVNTPGTLDVADAWTTAGDAIFAMDAYGLDAPPVALNPDYTPRLDQDFIEPGNDDIDPPDDNDNGNVNCDLSGDPSQSATASGHDFCLISASELADFDPTPYNLGGVPPGSVS